MKLLTTLCIAAAVVAFAVPAFAETQNVKVSGDIAVVHAYLMNGDLASKDTAVGADTNEDDNEDCFMQTVGLNIEADLTDNISTYVRIINERAWDAEDATTNDFDISLDEAYVTLKEMLYAPLTLKIGRQNAWFGKGFIVGNAGVNVWDSGASLPGVFEELSDMTAFDAIRATLDYDPWTVDLMYAKIDGDNAQVAADLLIDDDIDLLGVNVGYKFTKYDAEAEAYWFLKSDKEGADGTTALETVVRTDETNTLGLRGSFVPFDNMNVWAEGAFQVGKYSTTQLSVDRDAYALDLGAEYTFTDVRWTPKLGLEYIFWSGEDVDANNSANGDWEGWEPMYPGKFDTIYAAFRNITKFSDYDVANNVSANELNNGSTNQHQIAVFGRLNPMTDITLDGRFTSLTFDASPIAGQSDDLGWELDGYLTYDYTEDVAFKVSAGMFVPGDYYPRDNDDTAAEILSSVKVNF